MLELHLDEPRTIPRLTPRGGTDRLTIRMVLYPTVDYLPLCEAILEDLERRGIPVEVRAGRVDRILHSLLELALIPTH